MLYDTTVDQLTPYLLGAKALECLSFTLLPVLGKTREMQDQDDLVLPRRQQSCMKSFLALLPIFSKAKISGGDSWAWDYGCALSPHRVQSDH